MTWRLEDEKGQVLSKSSAPGKIDLSADSTRKLMDIGLPAGRTGKYALRATVAGREGKVVSENNYEFRVE